MISTHQEQDKIYILLKLKFLKLYSLMIVYSYIFFNFIEISYLLFNYKYNSMDFRSVLAPWKLNGIREPMMIFTFAYMHHLFA